MSLQASSTHALEPQHTSEHTAHEQPLRTNRSEGEQRHSPEQHQPARNSADLDSSLGIMNLLDDESEVSPAIREAMQRLLQQTEDPDSAAPSRDSLQHPYKLEGTAYLAWLPDGHLIGKQQASLQLPDSRSSCRPLADSFNSRGSSNACLQLLV